MNNIGEGLTIALIENNNEKLVAKRVSMLKIIASNGIIEKNIISSGGIKSFTSSDLSSISINFASTVTRGKFDRALMRKFFSAGTANCLISCDYSFALQGQFIVTNYVITKSEASLPVAQISLQSAGEIQYTESF